MVLTKRPDHSPSPARNAGGRGQGEVGQSDLCAAPNRFLHSSFFFHPFPRNPASPSRHLRLVAARCKHRTTPDAPSAGTVSPAPCPDSPALQTVPLRCTNPLRRLRGVFRCVPTVANWRDRPQIGRTARNTSRMSRGFARHEPAIARDASHGQDTAIGREAPPGQGIGINREHDHFPDATLRWRSISPPGRMSDLTDKTNLV